MDVLSAIHQRRSIRKFQNHEVAVKTLLRLVSLARLHASAANRQPIRYALIAEDKRDILFSCLRWAAYLPDFEILPEQRPAAYILVLTEESAGNFIAFEAGAAATNIMLAAQEFGLSTCCLGIADSETLERSLEIPKPYKPMVVIALGYGEHCSQAVPYNGSCRYYTDENGNFSVPKIDAKDLLVYADLSENNESSEALLR